MTFKTVNSGKGFEWTSDCSGLRNEWGMRKQSHFVLIMVSGREGELIYLERYAGLEVVA